MPKNGDFRGPALKLQRRKPRVPLDNNLVSKAKTPEEVLEGTRLETEVQWAITMLPIDYRRLIVLRHFGNLSYRDMSGALDVPEKTVKSRLFTARRMLRDILLKRGMVEA